MVSGRLQCLGSCQHLKGRFGAGYQVDVSTASVANREASLNALRSGESVLHDATVEEEHAGYLRLRVGNDVDLAESFRSLEQMKEDGSILDYSVSQSTLEQIFINFAKDQEEEKGAAGIKGQNTNSK